MLEKNHNLTWLWSKVVLTKTLHACYLVWCNPSVARRIITCNPTILSDVSLARFLKFSYCSRPTRLEKSIDTVKRKLSQVSLSDKLEYTNNYSRPYYKIGTDGNDSEDDEDCPFHGYSVYLHTNEGINDQESNRPNSKASSGYGSCPRDSTHSSSSYCDVCRK